MFGFQTLSCLHDIPIVRSSTDKLQDVYAKAKDTSVLIRLPCNLAETVIGTSLKVTLTVVNPFLTPFRGSVRVIDGYAAQKIRQMESKYPVINTRTEDVMNTFNEKTEPVRNAMNSVKDSTTSTIQHGKETVSNVATATVNKASGVADSVFSFCETHVSGAQRGNSSKPAGFVFSNIGSLLNYAFQTVQLSFIWFRMLAVFFLLKIKQINDLVLNKIQRKPLATVPQRLLILGGAFLEYFIARVRPDDRTLAELKKSKQQARSNPQQQQQYFANRPSLKPDPAINTRQSVVVTKQETVVTRSNGSNYVSQSRPQPQRQQQQQQQQQSPPHYSNLTDKEELYARLANNDYQGSMYNVDNDEYTIEPDDLVANGDIAELHAHLNPTDVELLYARLPADVLPVVENDEPLNPDQQQLHARLIAAGLERQGYSVDGNDNENGQ